MTLPNFLIIGAPRAGTTTLYHYLAQHPDVFMSEEKEPNFFLFDGSGPRFTGPNTRPAHARTARTIDEYRNLFAGAEGYAAVGEGSTQYLYSAHAAQRIAMRLPKAKLVAIVRHPVERAYSSYLHLRGLGEEPAETFERALELEDDRKRDGWWPQYLYVDKGLYSRQVQQYLGVFPADQLRIYTYEDLSSRPEELRRDLFDYLEIDVTFTPTHVGRTNASGVPRAAWLHRLLTTPSPPKAALKRLVPRPVAEYIHQGIRRMNLDTPALAPDTRAHLLNAFRADTLQLQGLIGRDLTAWLS